VPPARFLHGLSSPLSANIKKEAHPMVCFFFVYGLKKDIFGSFVYEFELLHKK